MSKQQAFNLLAAEHFHAVDAITCEETMTESQLNYSIDMGKFSVHFGIRYGSPIVIVEHHDQQADELSGIWFNEGQQ